MRALAAERGETVRQFVLDAVTERLERLGIEAPGYDEAEAEVPAMAADRPRRQR